MHLLPERRKSNVLVRRGHNSIRLALAFVIFLLAAVASTSAMANARLEAATT